MDFNVLLFEIVCEVFCHSFCECCYEYSLSFCDSVFDSILQVVDLSLGWQYLNFGVDESGWSDYLFGSVLFVLGFIWSWCGRYIYDLVYSVFEFFKV